MQLEVLEKDRDELIPLVLTRAAERRMRAIGRVWLGAHLHASHIDALRRTHSDALKRTQTHSDALRRNQTHAKQPLCGGKVAARRRHDERRRRKSDSRALGLIGEMHVSVGSRVRGRRGEHSHAAP